MRSTREYLVLVLKGMGMGAADVVPGVSGGTIALITGVYEELINSLKSFNAHSFQTLLSGKIVPFLKQVNFTFLIALFGGIALSILSLSKAVTYLLEHYPEYIWAFFFGLIVASALLIGRQIDKWNAPNIIALLLGTGIAYWITMATPAQTPEDLWFIFLAGMVAICAMILPGISGAFILLLMGKYAYIFTAISEFNLKVIGIFMLGAITGLLSFSHVLSWMFRKYHNLTLALLSGFMIGSLNKVWPWKITDSWRINSKGVEVPFLQHNVYPGETGTDHLIWLAIVWAVVGFVVVWVLERVSPEITRS
ncbi:MAG TPA: DUF368 domain-containing protein [Flavobacteriales bacterium]|mgnify:CR=1 FL=1|jgi:putative membrane protein|nr:DUF368 domain-containing protein [Flavobacteriales bacterium]